MRSHGMARKTGSHAEITGPRIREAALRLFAQHGYAAVSMRQIAGEVGVQAGALYTYTPDKQALLFDLLKAHMEHLLHAWEQEPAPAAPLASSQNPLPLPRQQPEARHVSPFYARQHRVARA